MADLADIAYLSALVYGPGDLTLPNDGKGPPPGWTALGAPDSIAHDSFYAQAYKNNTTNEIVISVRGTVPTLANNLFSDAALAARADTNYAQDAINYAIRIARQNPTSTLTLTGHSLGGYAAQAALARLVDSGISPNASAVVFNAPGITNSYFLGIASHYNAYSFDAQGDIVNGAGGVHLGQTVTLNIGPSAADEWQSFKTGFSNSTALLSALFSGVKGIAGSVLSAHSMDNFTTYFGGPDGANTLGSKTAAQFISAGLGSSPSSLIQVDPTTGAATISDGSGDALTLQSAGNQLLAGSLTLGSGTGLIGSGSLTGLQSELAADGTGVTIPLSSGSAPAVFGATIPSLFEMTGIVANGAIPLIVGTNPSDLGIGVGDQELIPNSSSNDRFEFNVPAVGQVAAETIEGGTGTGSVWVNGAGGYGQLQGGSAVSGVADKWIDANGTTYTFQDNFGSSIGTLTITGGSLGTNPANSIVIDNFNLGAAATRSQGFLGISLPESLYLSPGANTGGGSPTSNFVGGTTSAYTLSTNSPVDIAQSITLALSGASPSDFEVEIGNQTAPLSANGTFTVTLPAGETDVSFSLIDRTSDDGSSDIAGGATLQLSAAIPNPANPGGAKILSETLTIAYSPESLDTSTAPHPTSLIASGSNIYQGDGGNDSISPTVSGALISATNSADDIISVMATGGVGGNIIYGGSGNDVITLAGSDNFASLGGGFNTVSGGTNRNVVVGHDGDDINGIAATPYTSVRTRDPLSWSTTTSMQ